MIYQISHNKTLHVTIQLLDKFANQVTVAGCICRKRLTYFPRVIEAGKGGEAKAIGLPATHDLPNVVGHVPGDQCFVDSKEGIPVFLEYLFKRE